MKNEIKEILKYIDQFVYVDQTYNDIKLSKVDSKILLDYTTNLQKENKRLNNIIEEKIYLYNKLSTESECAINKLNNIINELEKYLENEIRLEMSLDRDMVLRGVFTKLLELKGSDK